MTSNIYLLDIIINILKQKSVFASRKEVYKVLFSDSHFPSLAAVAATLSYFGIESTAYLARIEDLKGLNNVLVHTSENEGHFYLMNRTNDNSISLYDGRNRQLSISQFTALWDGVILTADKEHNFEYVEESSKDNYILYAGVVILIACSIVRLPYNLLYIFIANILGLICSFILFHQQANIYNHTSFCKIGKSIDCNYVSQRNPVAKWMPTGLPIMGIYYFLFDTAYLTGIQTQSHLTLFANVSAAIFMVVLTLYQFVKIKKYCLFCMSITFIVVAKLGFFTFPLPHITFHTLAVSFLFAVATYIICHLLYFKTVNSKSLLEKETALLGFKRDKRVLSCYFEEAGRLNIPHHLSLNFGNANAPVTITTIISLDCKHCKKALKEINSLTRKFSKRYHWQLVIDGIEMEEDNKETFIKCNRRQLQLYTLYMHNQADCLKTLLASSYNEPFHISDEAIETYKKLLSYKWDMRIEQYPSILINNYKLPDKYQIADIPYISDIVDKDKNKI